MKLIGSGDGLPLVRQARVAGSSTGGVAVATPPFEGIDRASAPVVWPAGSWVGGELGSLLLLRGPCFGSVGFLPIGFQSMAVGTDCGFTTPPHVR